MAIFKKIYLINVIDLGWNFFKKNMQISANNFFKNLIK